MAWLDGTYLQNAVGSPQGYALGLLTTNSGTTTTSRFDQYELLARSRVISVLQFAGYPAPSATLTTPADASDPVNVTNAFLRQMTCSILLNDCYSLVPGIKITSEAQAAIRVGLTMLDALYEKRLAVPGLTAVALDGYGGNQFNVNANTGGAQPILTTPEFRRLRGSSF